MLKMIVKGDETKLNKSGELTIDEFNTVIKKICLGTEFIEEQPGIYKLDSQNELGRMIVLKSKFSKLGYIIPNLSKWTTIRDGEEVNEIEHWHRNF